MRLLLTLLIVVLSVNLAACNGTGTDTGSASKVSSDTATKRNALTNGSTARADVREAGGIDVTGAGGPENIREFGREASAVDKNEITMLVESYYAAAAADDGVKACGLIYSLFAEAIPEDYGRAPGPPATRGNTCTVVMSKLFKLIPSQPAAVLATTRVTGVRINGRRGYAQLHSSGMHTGEIPVERERGAWKIDSLIGVNCTKCAPH